MSPEAQRVAIAEACGWDVDPHEAHDWGSRGQWCVCPGDVKRKLVSKNMNLPQYLTDLNAMREAEKAMADEQRWDYCNWLTDELSFDWGLATAAQRAEAFLRTLNLWDDSK